MTASTDLLWRTAVAAEAAEREYLTERARQLRIQFRTLLQSLPSASKQSISKRATGLKSRQSRRYS